MCLKGIAYNLESSFCWAFALNNLYFYESVGIFNIVPDSLPETVNVDDARFSGLEMNDKDVCSIGMIFSNPLSGKVSELSIVWSDDSVNKVIVIFRDYVIDVDNFYTGVFAGLKNCVSSANSI